MCGKGDEVKRTELQKIRAMSVLPRERANQAALESCPGPHEFEVVKRATRKGAPRRKQYQCRRCGGKAEEWAVVWYERGLKHGARR